MVRYTRPRVAGILRHVQVPRLVDQRERAAASRHASGIDNAREPSWQSSTDGLRRPSLVQWAPVDSAVCSKVILGRRDQDFLARECDG